MGASMRVRELRFFGLEHPLQMFIAIGLVHMGQARARKAATDRGRFRWAAGAFTVATLLILTAIPWWRPLVRNPVASAPVTPAAMVAVGDAARGEALFTQPVGGQPACSTCHTLDETRIVGPGLGGVAARTGERVPGESAEAYLYNSIAHPGAFIVEGYANVMPAAYADTLTGEQLADLVAYLLTLRE
jgi:mono/diheme cytochrome c family protein